MVLFIYKYFVVWTNIQDLFIAEVRELDSDSDLEPDLGLEPSSEPYTELHVSEKVDPLA